MLQLDLIGLGLTVLLVMALVPGRWRTVWATLAVLLGEVGQLVAAAVVGPGLKGYTAAGAVGRLLSATVPSMPAGLWAVAFLLVAGWAFGSRAGRVCTAYGAISGILLLAGAWRWGVWP